uniref:Secreted protein n=1 Tax=Clytia hemisphaerica TaxID=252671 RepID=A0A7M5ULS3_9CNID|eukprot:TCONS_00008102-protein
MLRFIKLHFELAAVLLALYLVFLSNHGCQVSCQRRCPTYCSFGGRCFCNAGYHSLGGKRSLSITYARDDVTGQVVKDRILLRWERILSVLVSRQDRRRKRK